MDQTFGCRFGSRRRRGQVDAGAALLKDIVGARAREAPVEGAATVESYGCAVLAERQLGEKFPWGTLGVNILGSFVIGLADMVVASGGGRHLVMAGLCGGFTTFSAFGLQTLNLLHQGHTARAAAYVAASVAACLVSVWLGHLAGFALGRGWL
jgi:CrcB protein